ncbi:MAG TPA: sulfurtransferase TusA family protein, partial [Gemmobacter sp.]|nr:sulfurtransferase TusA family protein [Gemmobacter sp.]
MRMDPERKVHSRERFSKIPISSSRPGPKVVRILSKDAGAARAGQENHASCRKLLAKSQIPVENGEIHLAIPDEGPDEGAELIDARGLKCPMPVILLGRRIAKTAAGGRVALVADDPASRLDIPVWCARNGHFLQAEGPWPDDPAAR